MKAAAFIVMLAAPGLAQCDRPEPAVVEAPVTTTAGPAPLGRADVLALLTRSAASGGSDPQDAGLAGRSFELRLPFGCREAVGGARPGLAGWTRAQDGRALELSLTPVDWTRSPLVGAEDGVEPGWDRVDGLWIARPWSATDVCAQAAPAVATTETGEDGEPIPPPVIIPSPQTAGLAIIHGTEASRLGRRQGEAWRLTVRGEGETPAAASAQGYRLVLGGRMSRFPDGRTVRCTSPDPDIRPVCVAAVELDRVAFEDAAGAQLSEWRPG